MNNKTWKKFIKNGKILAEEEYWQQEEQQRQDDQTREEQKNLDNDDRHSTHSQDESSSWAPHLISTEDDTWCDSKELEISVKSNEDDGKKVKKYIVSYESKVIEEAKEAKKAREDSPAVSHGGSFFHFMFSLKQIKKVWWFYFC